MRNIQLRWQVIPYPIQIVLVAVLYFVAAKLGLQFATVGENVTLVWPPAGLALAAMVLSNFKLWPGVTLGALLVHVTTGFHFPGIGIVTAGNTLEVVAGAYLLRRFVQFHPGFDRARDVLGFVVLAVMISPIISAVLGTLALLLNGDIPAAVMLPTGLTWWAGDAMGILIVAPPLLIWATQREIGWSRQQFAEAVVITLSVVGISYLVFQNPLSTGGNYPLAYLTFPFLVWVALRFGQRGTSTIALVISAIAVLATFHKSGPFARSTPDESELFLASFIVVETITSMLLAAVLADHKRVEAELMRERDFATQVMNALGQGVSVTGETGRFEFVNPAYAHMMGYEPQDLIGKLPREIMLPEDHPIVEKAYQERNAGKASTYESRFLHADGRVIHTLISGSPHWHGNRVKGAITAVTDLTAQKQTENALRESQARLKAVLENLPFHLWVTDMDGRYILQSPASVKHWGSFIGKRFEDLGGLSEATAEQWQSNNRRVLSGEILRGETSYPVEGEVHHFYYVVSPIRDSGAILGMLGVDVDITDLKRTEQALKQNEEANRVFLDRLKALHEISIELAEVQSFDELTRRAIELGRSKLKFDRLGMWFIDEDMKFMRGSFGTDENGDTRDERGQILPFDPEEYPTFRIKDGEARLFLNTNAHLYNDRYETIGEGWSAMAYLQDAGRLIGSISTDNLLNHVPLEPYQLELLSLYAQTLGHLCIRKRSEQKLRETEEKFSKVFHSNLTGISISTLDEARFEDVNDTFVRLLGYQREEIIGRTAHEVNTWGNLEERKRVLQAIQEKGTIQQEEILFRAKSGELRNMLTSLEIIELGGENRLLGMFQDVTERKRAEEALQESEARFRSIFEGASIGIAVVDRKGHVVSTNPGLTHILGYTEAELRLMPFKHYTHPDDVEANMNLFNGLLAGANGGYLLEKRYIRKSGSIAWVRTQVSRFPSPQQGQDFALSLVEDITERKEAEDALQQLTAELEQRVIERTAELEKANDRLTELDRLKTKFIADVSHELRTPLAVLNTRVYLLQHSKPEKHAEYLNALKQQIERLTNFVNTILDLSRLELGANKIAFGPVNLNEIAEQVVTTLSPRAEMAGLAISLDMDRALPPVRGELNQLAQVATNLVANAINYTPNGSVKIRTEVDESWVYLEVQDTGVGIHPDDLAHLFERFYRGERAGQSNIPGTGLGLSIVKEIVDLHSGEIQIESEVGKGSRFRVWLPRWHD